MINGHIQLLDKGRDITRAFEFQSGFRRDFTLRSEYMSTSCRTLERRKIVWKQNVFTPFKASGEEVG